MVVVCKLKHRKVLNARLIQNGKWILNELL